MIDRENPPEFLKVKLGDTVLLGEDELAKVIAFIGRARDPGIQTLFQTADVDKGAIHWV